MTIRRSAAPDPTAPTARASAALTALFTALDAEDWDLVVEHLDQDAELADELTGTWLRGRDSVARYLRAQRGIVTQIVSTPTDVVVRQLAADIWLVTFNFDQRYLLMGQEHQERLTGLCVIRIVTDQWSLLAYHLGGVAHEAIGLDAEDTQAAEPGPPTAIPRQPADDRDGSLGERLRRRRTELALSLRTVAERAGVSASLVSQVERSVTDPSISALTRIAAALDLTLTDLVGEARIARNDLVLARGRDRHQVGLGLWGITVESFPSLPTAALQAHIRNYSDVARGPISETPLPGDTLLYLLEGAAEITASGGSWSLYPGDGVFMRAATKNDLRPLPGQIARILVVQAAEHPGSTPN